MLKTVDDAAQPAPSNPVHAFADDALGDHDAVALAALMRARKVSAVEVVRAAIERAQKVNPIINAIALDDFATAIEKARQPPDGVFSGVPTFVKDNTNLRGLPSNHGSRAVNARPAKADAAFAKQFLAQGFVCLGKSRLPEFGLNASTEFVGAAPTRNPWHCDFSTGASSGGSAALVAAGVVPIAHANDGGGSIRIPAACCGLIGLKPTRGRLVQPEAARVLPVDIVADGVLTRSVRDTAHFFAAAESFHRNPKLPAVGLVQGPGQRRLRVGVVHDSITGHRTDEPTRSTVAQAAQLLESMGHSVDEMPLPIGKGFADDFSIYWGMLSFLIATFGKRAMSPDFDRSKLDNLTTGLGSLYKRNAWKTPAVIYRLRRLSRQYARIFEGYDVVLSPVLAHTTPKLGYLSPEHDFDVLFDRLTRYVSFTPLNNAAGGPGISLPMGATADGLPVAVHFSANHGDERTLLELAFEIETAKPWRRIHDLG
ncbi:MAG: amidase [Deltaproteobacteria bacterium]|nr:amidase [Deltaproteobacteria bacterium]